MTARRAFGDTVRMPNLYMCTGKFTPTQPVIADGPSQACEKYARHFAPVNGHVHVRHENDSWVFDVKYRSEPRFEIKLDRERSRSI